MNKYQKVLRHLEKVDPKIYKFVKEVDYDIWFEKRPNESHEFFHALVRAIIGQQLSTKAASTIYVRFVELLENNITPVTILAVNDQQLRDVGMSWSKVSYVRDLADKVTNDIVHLNKLESMSEDEIIKDLTMIKGIGPWTAEMFMMFTLRREDIFSYGDLGLKKGITKVYGLESPTKDQIEEIVTKWSPYKTYGSIALWESLEDKL